jgi:DNA-directed RNA polymerase subunit beta
MLKTGTFGDEKINARCIGPYSLFISAASGGKDQFGGQLFGGWKFGHGSSALPIHSGDPDSQVRDVVGRLKTYDSIVMGDNIPSRVFLKGSRS